MIPSNEFLETSFSEPREFLEFWSFIRYASQMLGYSSRGKKTLRRYSESDIVSLAKQQNFSKNLVNKVHRYLNYRSECLERISLCLMTKEQAKKAFYKLVRSSEFDLENPPCPLPRNKQKGEKRHPAYFTCIINILTYQLKKRFVSEARELVTIRDKGGKLLMTLSRRTDGAYPDLTNPVAIWEVKEFYSTTTFGSRVADGVYETSLDGYELKEISPFLPNPIRHYLLIDGYLTWWEKGKSYLCRLVDIMHMGLVDEVIFGKEVFDRWPTIVSEWP